MRRLLLALGLVVVLAASARAQTVQIDTATTFYKADTTRWDRTGALLGDALHALRLSGWRVTLRIDTLANGNAGQTWTREEYRQAIVILNPVYVKDSLDAAEVLLHEAWHIKLSPLTSVAWWMARGNSAALEALREREEGMVTDLSRLMWLVRP